MIMASSTLILVGVMGALGVLLRYFVNHSIPSLFGLPVSTIVVNVIGSFSIGFLYQIYLEEPSSLNLAIMAGFLGGLTTFSGFSLDTLKLLQQGQVLLAFINVFSTVLLCLICCWLGMKLRLLI